MMMMNHIPILINHEQSMDISELGSGSANGNNSNNSLRLSSANANSANGNGNGIGKAIVKEAGMMYGSKTLKNF